MPVIPAGGTARVDKFVVVVKSDRPGVRADQSPETTLVPDEWTRCNATLVTSASGAARNGKIACVVKSGNCRAIRHHTPHCTLSRS